jgi:hypothetical protein
VYTIKKKKSRRKLKKFREDVPKRNPKKEIANQIITPRILINLVKKHRFTFLFI